MVLAVFKDVCKDVATGSEAIPSRSFLCHAGHLPDAVLAKVLEH